MSTESFWHFHIGESVPIWFEAREPDPANPGKYRAMDLGGGIGRAPPDRATQRIRDSQGRNDHGPGDTGQGVGDAQPGRY